MKTFQLDVERYQQNTTANLRYETTDHSILIYNPIGTLIAELNLEMIDEGIYRDIWYDFVTPDEFQEIMGGPYLDFFVKSKVIKKLCNTDELKGGIDDATNEWFNAYLVPRLQQAGLRYNAIVLPKEVFANISMSEFRIGDDFTTRMFQSREDAVAWLNEMK